MTKLSSRVSATASGGRITLQLHGDILNLSERSARATLESFKEMKRNSVKTILSPIEMDQAISYLTHLLPKERHMNNVSQHLYVSPTLTYNACGRLI